MDFPLELIITVLLPCQIPSRTLWDPFRKGRRVINRFEVPKVHKIYEGNINWTMNNDSDHTHQVEIPNSLYFSKGCERIISTQHWAQKATSQHGIRVRLYTSVSFMIGPSIRTHTFKRLRNFWRGKIHVLSPTHGRRLSHYWIMVSSQGVPLRRTRSLVSHTRQLVPFC